MERANSDAPLVVASLALLSAVVAHVLGWGFLVHAFRGAHLDASLWTLGGSGLALIFNGFAIGLGITALLLRMGKRAPFALPIASVALVLGVVGMVGVALLGFLGLVAITPGVR